MSNTVIQVEVSDLKPLYGIRDFLNEITSDICYKEKAATLLPHLGNIGANILEIDQDIEPVTNKKQKLQDLQKNKMLITEFTEERTSLTPQLRELLNSDCIEYIRPGYGSELEAMTFNVSIEKISSVFGGSQQSDKYHFGGFVFQVAIAYLKRDGEHWVGTYLRIWT